MGKLPLQKGSRKNYKRLLHLTLSIIFIITSIWTSVLGETVTEDIGNGTNPKTQITDDYQAKSTEDNTDGISKDGSADNLPDDSESNLEDNSDDNLPDDSQDNRKEQKPGQPEGQNREQSQEQNQDPDQDQNLERPQDQNQDQNPAQEQSPVQSDAQSPAQYPTQLPDRLQAQPQGTIQILSDFGVTNLKAAPNMENNAIILTWDNPVDNEDFYCVVIEKSIDTGEEADWEYIGNTEENSEINTFEDTDVFYYINYKYRVIAVDMDYNIDENPPEVSARLNSPQAILLQSWDLGNNGVINLLNFESYRVNANIMADNDIVSIEYELSTDNSNWSPIDETIIDYDYGLEFNSRNNSWNHHIYLNFTETEYMNQDSFWIKVTATDIDGTILSDVQEISIDMVCEDATDFTADADAESAEIRLSWSVPDDYMYGILYKGNYSSKYGWQWQYLKNIDTTSYTDTDVDPDNLYKTYKYRILIYDVNGNESQNPPEITVNFDTPGPIGFMRWYLTTEDGKINRNNSSNYSINAYFYSINPINTIKYNYSLDGETWLDLTPFISSDSGTNFDQKEACGNHYIRINIGDESGIPDGGFHIQAICTDEEGNIYIEEKMLIKDTTLPQNVTNITALPNEDNTAIVLTWTNPASDLEYLIIERDNRNISPLGFNLETFTDSDVKAGQKYTYRFMVYDAFGNYSLNPPAIDAILSTENPILESMNPEDGYLTKETTLGYSATFRSDKIINKIVFEASKDGEVWTMLKDDVPRLEYNGYYLSGSWDISSLEEEEWTIRATAYAEDGGMASETRRVFIDHKAPSVPENFSAEVTSNNTISFTWDTVEGAEKYYLRRDYANPEYYGPSQQTIYPPEHSYIWSGLYKERPYIFTLRSVDSVGNTSEAASILIEIHEGPEIILDEGYNVYTNNSSYVLRGTTVPGAAVTVNGEAVLVDEGGKFSYNSVLTVIDNSFTIMSKKDGITHTVKQSVVYDTQVPTINQFSPYYSTYFGPDTARISISTSDNNYIHRQVLQVKRSEELPWEDIIEIPYGQTSVYLDITSNVGDGGPLEDGAYKFRLLVWDRAGNVAGEDLVRIWTIDSTRPEPPTNLTAAEETGKITLSWEASISPDLKTSSQYKLYRSTKTGGNYILIATTSNTRYENTTVSEGVTYYYVVTATDKAGNESEYSNEISASPQNDITLPEFRSLPYDGRKYGGAEAKITMEATDNSPKGVEKFILEYSNDNGASWESLTLGASSKTVGGVKVYYRDYNMSTTGMVSGDYIFRFSAVDYSGNTVTVDRNFIFDLSVAAVQNLTARSGEGSIILEWEVPPDNDINSYDIMRSTYYSGGYNTAKTLYGGDIKTYTDTAITLGKRFYYKIVSKDSYYPYPNQSVSEIVSAVASDDITPPQITYINIEDSAYIGGKTISLNVRATDNKKPISAVFFGSQDGGVTWEPLNIKWTNSTILPDNVTYSFFYNWTTTGFTSGEILVKIIVKDEAGNEGEAQRTWNLDLDVSPTTNLRTTPGDGSILIEWDPVTDEDINSSNAYNILRSESSGGPYSSVKSNLGKNTTQYTDTGVQTGKTYYYVIRSRDNFGNETLSSEIAAMPAGDEIRPVINAVTPDAGATIGGPVSHTLRVDASDNAGMLGATAEIEYSVDGENWTPVNQNIEGPYNLLNNKFYFTARWNLIDMVSGNYMIRYTITDGAGNSSNLVADYYIDRTGPSAPENLLATYGQKAIGLVWEAVPETDAISYYVYRANTLNGEYTRIKIINIIDGEESNIYSDNTVVDGITYFYKVTSVDKFYQEGPASNIASAAAIPDTTPPVVTLIEPDHHSILGLNAQITVTAEDNAALSSITLEYNAGEDWITIGTIATLDVAVFEWSTKGLSGNVQVRAIARDSAGNVSDGSLYRAYTIDNTGPSVTGLKGTAFGGDIVLEWDSVPDRDLAYFLVEKKDSLGKYQVIKKVYNILGLNISGLQPAVDYWFRVTAFDKMGNPGEPAEIMVNSGSDSTPPIVTYEYSFQRIYSGNKSININPFIAKDNVGVKKLILEYSVDMINWTNICERVLDKPDRQVHFDENWDVSSLPEGDYYVRALAEDEAGNMSLPSEAAIYTVDHTKPAAPYDISVNTTAGYIEVMWKYSAEKDFSFFKLWRSESEDGTYENITPGNYVYMGYRDRAAETGKTYYYKVTVVDAANNESEPSEIITASLSEDKIAPSIYFSNPLEGDILSSKVLFLFNVGDDLALKSMKVEYQEEGSGDGDDNWNLIAARDYNPDGLSKKIHAKEEFYWENKGLPEGWYKVRITVEDSAGNVTGPLIMRYLVNNIAPPTPTITAEAGGWQANLSWVSDNNIDDFYIYKLYRTTVLGGSVRNILSTGEKSFNDIGIQPGIRYYYYVRAYDIYGNYSQSDTVSVVPTTEDKILPVADAGDEHILVVGMEGFFDGTLSSDNHRIASYHWDFGDGSTAVVSQPTHSYDAVGDYTVTLTVTDPAGNTAVDTTGVRVVSIDEVGILEVKVIDDVTGELLPGSSVVIDYPDGATHKTTTNSVGAAFVIAPPGDYEVYAFKTDFRPASAKVKMERGRENTVMIRLPKGSVVTGELKAERMDIDEIVAAGIDITDPANQNAYKFEIGLGFNMPDIPIIATKHKFIRPANTPQYYSVSEDGSKIIIRERIDEEGKGSGSGRVFYGEKIEAPSDFPAMAYMVIPGKTTWLKEFFDIGLTIQNAAEPEFVIENAWARLTIPDGLSLAPTREGQHEYVEMGSIPGGESKSVNWIIRGDKKGEYRLEAEFNGLLMPFEDEIKQIFRNDEPFRVWAQDAVLMHIITQDRADKGYPYNLKLGIENISEISLYNLSLELLEDTKANYIYAPNQKLIKSVAELKPGETLWGEYQLISAIEGLLRLKQSYNLKTGGNTDIEEEMSAVSVPENSPDNAPVLNQENKDDGTVSLTWGQVEGALGYKIYIIREDLRISMDPAELVYSCGFEDLPEELSEDMSVNLPEPHGPKDYVINTLIADDEGTKEVTLHAITGFSWIENAAEPTITVDPEILIVGRETELLVTAKEGGKPVHFIADPEEGPTFRINGTIDIGDLAKDQRLDDNGQVRVVVKPEKVGPIEIKSYLLGRFITGKTINAVLPEKPKQPQGLNASKGDRKAILTWFPNSEPEVKGYYIYQVTDNIWSKIHPGIYECDSSEGLVSYEVTGLNDNTTYTFQVSAVDTFNRESIPSKPAQVTLTIPEDTIAPWIVGSNPVSRQKDVPVDTKIQIFFSENIALWRTYEDIKVKVGDIPVEFTAEAEVGTNVLTITLNEELPLKAHCEVLIPEGAVRDKSLNELKSKNEGDYAYKLEFFTETENDTISPMLIAVSPKENARSVTVHSTIFLYFSEEIDKGPAYDNIRITANGIAVPHSKEINGAKIIIKPLSEPPHTGVLPYDSKIEIFVPGGAVVDGAGNGLEIQHSLKFYTDTVPDLTAPKIIRMKPSANSMDIPLNTELNIYFSERIKEGEAFDDISLYIDDQILPVVITIDENKLIIKPKPSENLPPNKLYRLHIPANAIEDLLGNSLQEEFEALVITERGLFL